MYVKYQTFDTGENTSYEEFLPFIGISYNAENKVTCLLVQGSHPRFCPGDKDQHRERVEGIASALNDGADVYSIGGLWATTLSACAEEIYLKALKGHSEEIKEDKE